ncbi:MAG: hypothetical protein SF339_09780 [Blastocatellia bacterium]|nr:hypothetical protein [Blastocatellia bacterium]
MSKRMTDREKLLFKLNRLNDNEIADLLTYLSGMERGKRERGKGDPVEDELLALLSSSYESRRARQVFEWESVRRKADIAAPPQLARRAQR